MAPVPYVLLPTPRRARRSLNAPDSPLDPPPARVPRKRLRMECVEISSSKQLRKSTPERTEHIYDDEVILETSDLRIAGESTPFESDAESDEGTNTDSEREIPVRRLEKWVVFNKCTRQMVPFFDLAVQSTACGLSDDVVAYGYVHPHIECSQEDEDWSSSSSDERELEDPDALQPDQKLQLSIIQEISWHHWDNRPVDPNVGYYPESERLDPHIYIRTRHAWYIVGVPSKDYRNLFSPFFLLHRMVQAAITFAAENPLGSFDDFTHFLESDEVTLRDRFDVTPVLRRKLKVTDYTEDSTRLHFLAALDELPKSAPTRSRLFRYFREDVRKRYDISDHTTPSKPFRAGVSMRRSLSSINLEKSIFNTRPATCVMPIVQSIGALVFDAKHQLIVEDDASDDGALEGSSRRPSQYHADNPVSLVWGPATETPSYFSSVSFDGVVYKTGDVVMIAASEEDAVRFTTNTCGYLNWFLRIEYFYEKGRDKYLHGQWLTHSSKTVLQELSHPNELFWLKSCDDIPVASILQQCDFSKLEILKDEPKQEMLRENQYFHRGLTYDLRDASFTELPGDLIACARSACEAHRICTACGIRILDERTRSLSRIEDGFLYEATVYHTYDFVYIYHASGSNRPLQLAQITDIRWTKPRTPEISVHFLHRHADILRRELRLGTSSKYDEISEQHIFFTQQVAALSHTRLAGKFFVQHKDNIVDDHWLQSPNHYIISHEAQRPGKIKSHSGLCCLNSSNLSTCDYCQPDRIEELELHDELLGRFGPLRGLELFAGAGGLSEGLQLSDMVQTCWSVEISPSCALTHSENHPGITIYNQDCNALLQHAVDMHSLEKQPRPLYSIHDKRAKLPPMPKPGDVDIIFGGPPCQAFSRANHHKHHDDIRTTLPGNFLSYVEFYRPSFVLIENVVGLLHHKLYTQNGKVEPDSGESGAGSDIEDEEIALASANKGSEVRMGMVKFIKRVLLALGYQVHMKVIQAAHYGSPQQRARVIFWAALRGIPLPPFPIPTHYHPQPVNDTVLVTNERMTSMTRGARHYLTEEVREWAHQRAVGAAPHYTVTIADAISDLPAFHWQNPHIEMAPTDEQKREKKRLRDEGIPVFDALSSGRAGGHMVGFEDPVPYASPPRSSYQRWIRRQVPDGAEVSYHYTHAFTAGVVERTVNIPLEGGANWKDLPIQIPPRVSGKNAKVAVGTLERLDYDASFRTSMTTLHPLSKASFALHPTQRRIYTVRECARAQGFPDHWKICSINTDTRQIIADQLRQIGNAVPVPLGLALGRGLSEAVFAWYKEREAPREESPEA